jgi:hypothetical protein
MLHDSIIVRSRPNEFAKEHARMRKKSKKDLLFTRIFGLQKKQM